jgi:uncharacterized protein YeaO (DUF488 family)
VIKLKRAYEEPAETDGVRILVERLWPRGLTKDEAAIDVWKKDVAPSTELRQWYGHHSAKWPTFRNRYRAELDANREAVDALRTQTHRKTVTFVYSSRETEQNSSAVLKEYLDAP